MVNKPKKHQSFGLAKKSCIVDDSKLEIHRFQRWLQGKFRTNSITLFLLLKPFSTQFLAHAVTAFQFSQSQGYNSQCANIFSFVQNLWPFVVNQFELRFTDFFKLNNCKPQVKFSSDGKVYPKSICIASHCKMTIAIAART